MLRITNTRTSETRAREDEDLELRDRPDPGKQTMTGRLYRKAVGLPQGGAHMGAMVETALRSAWFSLPAELVADLTAAMRADVTRVRVHTGPEADAATGALGAAAFALGVDIFFAEGAYDPTSEAGRRLLAHEVAHAVSASGSTGELEVSEKGDAAEHAADEAAERFVGRDRSGDHPLDRMYAAAGGEERARGEALPSDVRAQFEQSLGTNLSDVRVHTGAEAADASRALDANAFAHGRDIYFADGLYAPGTAEGRRLLAHEVAHTVQSGPAAGAPRLSEPGDAVEHEADAAADSMIAGRAAAVSAGAPDVIGREKPKPKAKPTITTPKTRISIGESVTLTGSEAGTWKASSGKPKTGDKNGSFEWRAGGNADPAATITLTVDGQDATQTIEVVAPTGIKFVNAGQELQSSKKAGNGMLLDIFILPLDVSFSMGKVTISETDVDASDVKGYFQKHGGDHKHKAFGLNAYIVGGNKVDTQDHAVSAPYDPPYEEGSFSWSIPTKYQIFDKDVENPGPTEFHTSVQTFAMDAAGAVTVTKDGVSSGARAAPKKESSW